MTLARQACFPGYLGKGVGQRIAGVGDAQKKNVVLTMIAALVCLAMVALNGLLIDDFSRDGVSSIGTLSPPKRRFPPMWPWRGSS
ncbi:MAG: hypothetical protein SCM96_02705 [Acidobacteriota bacterium]|nr:hypothetical protein [Acidobacteriota bacterium]